MMPDVSPRAYRNVKRFRKDTTLTLILATTACIISIIALILNYQ